jgi:hypothetical protein
MKRYLLLSLLGMLSICAGWPAHAENPLREAQLQNPPAMLVGTWRSGNFAYTFSGDGRYVYVGAMGGAMMATASSEEGIYAISGDVLIIQRQNGVLRTSQNYRQDLGPSTTTFRWALGNTQIGLALQLVYPNGGVQVFYKQ